MDRFDQMQTYVRVVEAGSLSAAARERGLSVAAVSRQLRATEDELGATLILRTTRSLRVTEAGSRWYEHCVRILDQVRSARDEVREGTTVAGRLVVSAPVTLGLSLVAGRLARLHRRHPALEVDLRLEDHPVDLIGHGVDLAIRAGLAVPDSLGLVARSIRRVRRVVMGSTAYLDRRGRPGSPADLSAHDALIQLSWSGPLDRWRLERAGEVVEVPVRGVLRATAPLALVELVRADLGLAWVPDDLMGPDLAAGTAERVLPEWASPEIDIWAVHRVELRGSPRIRALLEALA